MISNCLWFLIITITTVGYGDFYPFSNMGKVISIIIMLWGVFVVSLFVVTLTHQITFTIGEKKSYEML